MRKQVLPMCKQVVSVPKEVLPARKEVLPLSIEVLAVCKEVLPMSKQLPPVLKVTRCADFFRTHADTEKKNTRTESKEHARADSNKNYTCQRQKYN